MNKIEKLSGAGQSRAEQGGAGGSGAEQGGAGRSRAEQGGGAARRCSTAEHGRALQILQLILMVI